MLVFLDIEGGPNDRNRSGWQPRGMQGGGGGGGWRDR